MQQEPSVATEDHLVIHDLSTSDDQSREFADALRAIAFACKTWASITFIDKSMIGELQKRWKPDDPRETIAYLTKELEFESCDELILGQNLLLLNHLLDKAFPQARKFCFGDGIAINFTAEYYAPDSSKSSQVEHRRKSSSTKFAAHINRLWKQLSEFVSRPSMVAQNGLMPAKDSKGHQAKRPLAKEKYRVSFEQKYLLLPNMLDEQWESFVRLEPIDFRRYFDRIGENLEKLAGSALRPLREAAVNCDKHIVLLTSNFSETKRMALEGEVECYLELLHSAKLSRQTHVIIKPHPRDSYAKIKLLSDRIARETTHITTIDDPRTFYIPFESIYSHCVANAIRRKGSIQVICTSSASLSLEYFYGQRCILGFGEQRVVDHFAPSWQELRCLHERDLLKIADWIRGQVTLDGLNRKAA